MNQTKYLIRPIIIVIITITRIKKKTRKWTPSLITNSLTYVFFSCGNNFFFQICSYFIKQNCLEWFEILKTLLMTWAVEEYCLEINVILIQQINFRFSSETSMKQACFIADTSVYHVLFLGTMKLIDWTAPSKSYKKQNYSEVYGVVGEVYGGHFFTFRI